MLLLTQKFHHMNTSRKYLLYFAPQKHLFAKLENICSSTQEILSGSHTLLVEGYKVKQIFVFTTLLQWYLNHGILVSNVTKKIELAAVSCFEEFVNDISERRRQGVLNKTKTFI
ncbi:LOW QUALITY PROTEIN: hypothetical protein KUTeg_022296 [Tegillarca granosa]|uniref:Uncharacterized protein n=1 Tax=Tegillarca granosa TaxID=220873 RepID=A0ABQ9EB30_TEGGR|nr:LOW QUALITY PROTEIN: hypothetical protein KUTeg_022296 [Tegillarca granosa]